MKGIAGHQLRELTVTQAQGLPVTSVEQTWHDLAAQLTRRELVAAGDFLISGRSPLTTTSSLRGHLRERPGRRGSALARECLDLIRTGVDSPQESALRMVIVDAGLPEPEVNHVIRGPSGRFIARVDLAYPAERVAIEYEGDIHRTDRAQFRKDITRRERVEDHWMRVIRVTHDDLDGPELIDRIRRSLVRARQT
jgi:very-short-patch-repair endonuclease